MDNSNAYPADLAKKVFEKLADIKSIYKRPPIEPLTTLFETLFFTSLKTEEGQFIKVTITLIDPDNPDPGPPFNHRADRWRATPFIRRIPFTTKNLVKLCRAADTWSSSLAVYYSEDSKVFIWGMIDQAIHYQTFLNHEEDSGPEQPGLFQTTITDIASILVIMDYQHIASLKHNTLTTYFVDIFRRGKIAATVKSISNTLLKEVSRTFTEKEDKSNIKEWNEYLEDLIANSIIRILLRIQSYHHGGALLITPIPDTEINIKYALEYNRLRLSIFNLLKQSFLEYGVFQKVNRNYIDTDKDSMPVLLHLQNEVATDNKVDAKNELKGTIRFISSLSCVDGLILMDTRLNVVGFGAVITQKEMPKYVYVSSTSILTSDTLSPVKPSAFGTRHRSMFAYCWKNEGSLGFVVSQDGDVRAIMRVGDQLIMWENIRLQNFSRSKKLKTPKSK